MEGITTVNGRPYGTVEISEADRNLTLDVGALPAGLYEVTVTDTETADATEPASARLVVVHEQRDVDVDLPTPGSVRSASRPTGPGPPRSR
jgi:hypothetical protein